MLAFMPLSDRLECWGISLAHHEENAPQKWTVAGRDNADPGVVEREQDDGCTQHRERDALHARAVLFGRMLDPESYPTLHDVRRHQSGAPQLRKRK